MANGFQFKQFFIAHDKCAMKVNTDGVLLGAIADVTQTRRILDLGTGTGLVAIMLAQRSAAHVIAVEIEPNAYQQAVENCKKSTFSDRLQIVQQDVLQLNLPHKFDLIVANPPYFANTLSSHSHERDLARAASQSHLEWLHTAQRHLAADGKISFILPFDAAEALITQSPTLGLHCVERWHIQTTPTKAPKRLITTFCPTPSKCVTHSLTIHDENHSYTDAFKQLTRDFYLNF